MLRACLWDRIKMEPSISTMGIIKSIDSYKTFKYLSRKMIFNFHFGITGIWILNVLLSDKIKRPLGEFPSWWPTLAIKKATMKVQNERALTRARHCLSQCSLFHHREKIDSNKCSKCHPKKPFTCQKMSDRYKAIKRKAKAAAANGAKHIISKLVLEYPQWLPRNMNVNNQKDRWLCQERELVLEMNHDGVPSRNFSIASTRRYHKCFVKVMKDRRRKCEARVEVL